MEAEYDHARPAKASEGASAGSAICGGHRLAAITTAPTPMTANRCAAIFIGAS